MKVQYIIVIDHGNAVMTVLEDGKVIERRHLNGNVFVPSMSNADKRANILSAVTALVDKVLQ